MDAAAYRKPPMLAALHDLARVHDEHAIAEQPHNIEIVADEEIAQSEPFLEVLKEMEDHDLHRYVER